MKKKEQLVERTYRLTDSRSGESLLLKVGRDKRLLHFDETVGHNRAIRHCPNEKSIFVDEQSEHALVDPLIFRKGLLEVKREDQTTQKFLAAHPDNVLNGGIWFEEINDELEAGEDIEIEELVNEIKQTIKLKGDEPDGVYALEMVASIILNSVHKASKMQKSELKRVIYQYADSDPDYFTDDQGNINIFDDEYIHRKYLVLRALRDDIIKKSANNKSMTWSKNGKIIATAPQSIDLVEYFTDYLSSDDGMLVIEEIKKRT